MMVHLTAPAKADVLRVWGYYEKRRRGLGDEFLEELTIAIRLVKDFPLAPPEFWNGTRRVLLKRFPYGAAYRMIGEKIEIIIVAHTSRSDRVWRNRL